MNLNKIKKIKKIVLLLPILFLLILYMIILFSDKYNKKNNDVVIIDIVSDNSNTSNNREDYLIGVIDGYDTCMANKAVSSVSKIDYSTSVYYAKNYVDYLYNFVLYGNTSKDTMNTDITTASTSGKSADLDKAVISTVEALNVITQIYSTAAGTLTLVTNATALVSAASVTDTSLSTQLTNLNKAKTSLSNLVDSIKTLVTRNNNILLQLQQSSGVTLSVTLVSEYLINYKDLVVQAGSVQSDMNKTILN